MSPAAGVCPRCQDRRYAPTATTNADWCSLCHGQPVTKELATLYRLSVEAGSEPGGEAAAQLRRQWLRMIGHVPL